MKTYPFDDLEIESNVRQAANDVWDRMGAMIDSRITELKNALTAKAGNAAAQAAGEAQRQLTGALDVVDQHVSSIERGLATLANDPIFANAGLAAQSAKLQQAIDDAQVAITQQRNQTQQYGQFVGGVIQKALMAAL